ncbi:MAG: alpha/beta hydrolase family esterase [Candidatus Helarchaeota archaeon]
MNRIKYLSQMIPSILLILIAQGCYIDVTEESMEVQESITETSAFATEAPTQTQESVIGISELTTEVPVEAQEFISETPELTFELSTPIYGDLEFGGQKRFYFVYLPKNYSNSREFPLVIYLHSYGGSAFGEFDYVMLHQVADINNFVMVFPSAKYNWNSGIGDLSAYDPPDIDDVGFIKELIGYLSKIYSIDLERVYATGYSNGGFMAYKLACQLSDQIAAIASVSGSLSESTIENCDPKRPFPILHFHGTRDAYIPLEGMPGSLSVEETLNYWIEFNKCNEFASEKVADSDLSDNSSVELHTYKDCSVGSKIVFYKVIDGGHTWPGAGDAGYPAGNTNQDINASLVIWNFFKDYKLP